MVNIAKVLNAHYSIVIANVMKRPAASTNRILDDPFLMLTRHEKIVFEVMLKDSAA